MTINLQELFNKGWLGIQLKEGIAQLELKGYDENGQEIAQTIEANRIYKVTYLDMNQGFGLFAIDKENEVAFRINEKVWVYTSLYNGPIS